MTEERISELRALCAEYEKKKESCEAAGLGAKAEDIAADGVGRRALEALPELLDELELERSQAAFCKDYFRASFKEQLKYFRKAKMSEIARDEIAECCEELFELVDCLSTWLANAYIDPCLLPDFGRNDIEPPQPEDVIAYAKECIHGES